MTKNMTPCHISILLHFKLKACVELLLHLNLNKNIMKKFSILFIAFLSILVTSCEGPAGPPGPPGQNGVNFVGQSFERTTDLFAPNYAATFEIPLNIELFESDMVLVYHLIGIDIDGFDIWRLMPDTVYTNDGQEFQYNFEHNFDFVTVFIEAPSTFDFNSLLPGDTLNQTFRIVILPVDFVSSNRLDISNYYEVEQFIK
jgi:hypothetical protein